MTKKDVYFRVDEMHDMKVLVGGTAMQHFHQDLELKDEYKGDEDLESDLERSCLTVLLSGSDAHRVNLAVLDVYSDGDNGAQWSTIKKEFRRDLPGTHADFRERHDKTHGRYGVFSSAGLVFHCAVKHAGMAVQNYRQAAESSAIKRLERQNAKGPGAVDLPFLKGIEGLSAISRIFITTWPEDKYGKKEDYAKSGAVGVGKDVVIPDD